MARGYRSRRFRPRSTRRIKFRKSSLRRIKKDIMKCNFPTKVKFMGLTEKKVMFLSNNFELQIGGDDHPTRSFYLNPLVTENIDSILGRTTIVGTNRQASVSNWDKFCILGIYIKFQPTKNTWAADDADNNIAAIKCTYSMNNVPYDVSPNYDNTNLKNKQVFTFNSNEAFTIYIPAPTTMQFDDAIVHKSKTWWSLTDLTKWDNNFYIMKDENSFEEEGDDDSQEIGNPFQPQNIMHAGRIALTNRGLANYNVTINYKVALKG